MNKSIYKLAVLGFLGLGISAYAQTENYKGKVGVNTQQPNATLDVVAKNNTGATIEGFKTPELTGDALKTMTALLGEKNNGLVVFVTTAVTTADASTTAVTIPGYYRFNFTKVDTGLTGVESAPKLYAEKSWVRLEPTGLEFVVENSKGGRRLVGADEAKHGNIGTLAVDMSYQTGATAGIAFNSNVPTPIPVLEGATGDFSFVANTDNTASGQRASAFGYRAVAKGSTSFAAGNTNLAEGNQSVVFGYQNYAKGTNSAAFGQTNYTEANNSTAFGQGNTAKGDRSVVFGQNSSVIFTINQEEPEKSKTSNDSRNSVAMGTNVTITDSPNSLAYGANTTITNSQNAFAGGGGKTQITNGNSSVALGNDVQVTGNGSIGLGAVVRVSGTNSVAIGKETTVGGPGGVAIGYGAKAGANEVAIGGTSSSVILGKLKTEGGQEGGGCSENGKLSYNGTDFLGCAGGTWKKLNN